MMIANNVSGKTAELSKTSQRLSEQQLQAWQELGYGMFICFGMNTYGRNQFPSGQAPIENYQPKKLDVEQWVRVARDAGMKYIILTCKQVDGFALWPSAYTDYSVKNSKFNTDVIGEFVAACHKFGIKPGIYYCTWDNRHKFGSRTPDLSENYGDAAGTPTEANPLSGAPFISHLYQNFMTATIDEILDLYGPLSQFWIDIPSMLGNGYRQFLYNHIAEKNPDIIIAMNNGLKKPEDELRLIPEKSWPTDVLEMEQFLPPTPYPSGLEIMGKKYHIPGEVCLTLGKSWYWNDNDEPKPINELLTAFKTCREQQVNLLLSVPPNKDGVIPDRWITPLMELKQLI